MWREPSPERLAKVEAYVPFASRDARRAGQSHSGAGRPSGPGDDAAIHARRAGGLAAEARRKGIMKTGVRLRSYGATAGQPSHWVMSEGWWRRRESNSKQRV